MQDETKNEAGGRVHPILTMWIASTMYDCWRWRDWAYFHLRLKRADGMVCHVHSSRSCKCRLGCFGERMEDGAQGRSPAARGGKARTGGRLSVPTKPPVHLSDVPRRWEEHGRPRWTPSDPRLDGELGGAPRRLPILEIVQTRFWCGQTAPGDPGDPPRTNRGRFTTFPEKSVP